jgi:hypothetical protein
LLAMMRILPVVKAYPVLDQVSFSEAVCVAGITADPPYRWVRLFPLDFRGLALAQQFKKYAFIELDAAKSRKDSRPESHAPVLDTVRLSGEHLGTDNGTWRQRLPYFDGVMDDSMCEIQRRQQTERKSLGVFRPAEIYDLTVAEQEPGFAARQEAILRQGSLLGDRTGDQTRTPLEPLPIKARFKYRCSDSKCKGNHEQSLIDWELGAFVLRERKRGASGQELLDVTKARFLEEMCAPERDTRFIVGSMLSRPTSFLVLGLVWPKRASPKAPAGPQADSLF